MIRSFTVENFKSIDKLTMELGRFNVLVGENRSGKSNVLEALVVASGHHHDVAALEMRGVRVVPRRMAALFGEPSPSTPSRFDRVGDARKWSAARDWHRAPLTAAPRNPSLKLFVEELERVVQ